MRKYVKSWVTKLDFNRLYPGEQCEIEVSSLKPCYDEPQDVPEVHWPESSQSAELSDVPGVPPSIPGEEAEIVAPTSTEASASSITPTS
jgi:hypothetical protein